MNIDKKGFILILAFLIEKINVFANFFHRHGFYQKMQNFIKPSIKDCSSIKINLIHNVFECIRTKTLCVSSCVSPLTELLPLLVPIPRSLRSFASSSLYMAKLILSLRPLLPRSSIISEKVLFRRRWRSCSSNSSFFTSTTRSIICSCRFLRLLFQLSKFCEQNIGFAVREKVACINF